MIDQEYHPLIKKFPNLVYFNGEISLELDSFFVNSMNRIYNHNEEEQENIVNALEKTIKQKLPETISETVPSPCNSPKTKEDWEKVNDFLSHPYAGRLRNIFSGLEPITLRDIIKNHPGFDFPIDDLLDASIQYYGNYNSFIQGHTKSHEVSGNGDRIYTAELWVHKPSSIIMRDNNFFFLEQESYKCLRDNCALSGNRQENEVRYVLLELYYMQSNYQQILKDIKDNQAADFNQLLYAVRYVFLEEFENRLAKELKESGITVQADYFYDSEEEKKEGTGIGDLVKSLTQFSKIVFENEFDKKTAKWFVNFYETFLNLKAVGKIEESLRIFRCVEELYSIISSPLDETGKLDQHIIEFETDMQNTQKELEKLYGYSSDREYPRAKKDPSEDWKLRNSLDDLDNLIS